MEKIQKGGIFDMNYTKKQYLDLFNQVRHMTCVGSDEDLLAWNHTPEAVEEIKIETAKHLIRNAQDNEVVRSFINNKGGIKRSATDLKTTPEVRVHDPEGILIASGMNKPIEMRIPDPIIDPVEADQEVDPCTDASEHVRTNTGTDTRSYNLGESNYAAHKIQPWDLWLEYDLNPWDADIVKRVLRRKSSDPRRLDYEKIIHICKERIRQIDLGIGPE